MKTNAKLLILVIFLVTVSAMAQNKEPIQFIDFKVIGNLDSLEKTVANLKNRPKLYLDGLITLERSRAGYSDNFGKDFENILALAQSQHSALGLAMYQYLKGRNLAGENAEEAIKYLLAATEFFEKNNDTSGMISCYMFLINLNIDDQENLHGNLKSSKYYYDRILDLGGKSKEIYDKLISLQITIVFNESVNKEKNIQKGLTAYNEAIKLIDKNPKYEYYREIFYSNIAAFYSNHEDYRKAMSYQLKIYDLINNGYRSYSLKTYLYNLGYYSLKLKDYDKAEFYFKKAITYCKTLNKPVNLILKYSYENLSEAQFLNKKYNEAWATRATWDSLSNVYNEKLRYTSFTELQTKYETEQKEQANIQLQKEKNQLYVYLVIGGLLILSILYFLYRLRKANARIKEFMKQRDDFYTMMIHDIRGPISTLSIIGKVVGFLLKQNRISELFEVTNRINIISSQTDLMLNNMLEWGKENKFGLIIKPQTLDVSKIIDDLYQSYKSLAEAKGISMSVEMPTGLEIFADPKSIIIIIRNMIDNAQKFTQEGGLIKIIVQQMKESQQIAIQVKNSGVGIASEQLKQLQQIFADKIRPSVGEMGIGLGTILMNDFAKKNKATIEVNNESGFGTCFSLILPN